MKVFGVTGWKNSGKTGLVERLVSEFISRGLSVSTVKHAHHTFDVDHPGRDSYRHRAAGAKEVLLVSKNRWAIMHELRDEDEPELSEILKKVEKVDLVIIEGFKRDRHPKIEAFRQETGTIAIAREDESIVAVAADTPLTDIKIPVFDLNNTSEIADFISAVVFINFSTKSSGKNGVSAATEIKKSAFKFSAHRKPDKIPANGPKKPGIVSETIGSS